MTKTSDVVLYGASGYTGKLISESLARRGIPFVAAGRNQAKLVAALKIVAGRAGVESIDAEVKTAQHDVAALSDLFAGAKVVINVTGPFSQLGEEVVQAALAAGAHYLDTTGEQDFMLEIRDKYGDAFRDKTLLCAPGCAYMWTMGALAAEICLETPGIDTLELNYVQEKGVPSVASTRSFLRMLATPHYFLEENELREWDLARLFDTKVRGSNRVFKASPWGGGAEPVWYQHDPRVRNCTVLMCADNEAMELVRGAVEQIIEQTEGQPAEMREATANLIADTITPIEPDKEDPAVHRAVIACEGRGTINANSCTLVLHSPYVITGEFIAEAALHLLSRPVRAPGFNPIVRELGHRFILGMLADQGFLTVRQD